MQEMRLSTLETAGDIFVPVRENKVRSMWRGNEDKIEARH